MALGVGIIIGSASASHALVLDFGSSDGLEVVETGSFTQNGLTMSPVNSGFGPNHWDHLVSVHGATASDNSAGIHRGRNAEEVTFSYLDGAAFDLLSIDIEALMLQGASSVTGTFFASSGEEVVVSGIGTVDFTDLYGWTNITSFSFSVPLQSVMCDQGVRVDCSGMVLDNITFQAYEQNQPSGLDTETPSDIPEPGTLALFALGLAGLGFARRKRKA